MVRSDKAYRERYSKKLMWNSIVAYVVGMFLNIYITYLLKQLFLEKRKCLEFPSQLGVRNLTCLDGSCL